MALSKGKKKQLIEEFTNRYMENVDKYKDFAISVKSLLVTLLKINNINHHSVNCRSKDVNSLVGKLDREDYLLKNNSYSDINDLAGCRITFYLESDIYSFIQIARDEFDFVEEPKLSYDPVGYNDYKLIIKFNKNRLSLPEYKHYEGCICEIQLTTLLYHAWSEMYHSILYKRNKEFQEVFPREYEILEKNFKGAMEHLSKANYLFENIAEQYRFIKEGKQVFSIDFFNKILGCQNLNDLYNNLSMLKEYIFKFGDKTSKELNIVTILSEVIEKSHKCTPEPINSMLGIFNGHEFRDIVKLCVEIIEFLRVTHIDDSIKLLFKINSIIITIEQPLVANALKHLSEYNLNVLRAFGFSPQHKVINFYETLSEEELLQNTELILNSIAELLKPSFHGVVDLNHESFEYRTGGLTPTEQLKNIRRSSLLLLIRLFEVNENVHKRVHVIHIMSEATKTSIHGNSEHFESMVIDDIDFILNFFFRLLNTKETDNEIIKVIEETAFWIKRRYKDSLSELQKLFDLINELNTYQKFKVLVGNSSYFYEERDYKVAEKLRNDKIKEFVKEISLENLEQWKQDIKEITKNYIPENSYNYAKFKGFLFELSRHKPDISLKIYTELEEYLLPFVVALINGCWNDNSRDTILQYVKQWVDDDRYIDSLCLHFTGLEEFEQEYYKVLKDKALTSQSQRGISNLLLSLIDKCSGNKTIQNEVIHLIEILSSRRDFDWLSRSTSIENISDNLGIDGATRVLNALVPMQNITYELEELTEPIIKAYPELFIKYILDRIKFSRENNSSNRNYEIIPYEFNNRIQSLKDILIKMIPDILAWFKQDEKEYHICAKDIIYAVFPSINEELESLLINYINQGSKEEFENVLWILHCYDGLSSINNICRAIIEKYPDDEDVKEKVFDIMSQTGVVSGEYGFVDAYKAKKEVISCWKDESSANIRKFAKDYESYLNKRIVSEEKRAEAIIARNKLRFEGTL